MNFVQLSELSMKPFQILNEHSRKSIELYNRLMGCGNSETIGGGVFSLASVGSALAKAEQYKNKLLVADSNTWAHSYILNIKL